MRLDCIRSLRVEGTIPVTSVSFTTERDLLMAKFRIQSHGRLQEWVAEEKGYFKAEGLEHEFLVTPIVTWSAGAHRVESAPEEIQRGAFESIEAGRDCNLSSACHWTVNMAASAGHGKMCVSAYSVSPTGIFVAPESSIQA